MPWLLMPLCAWRLVPSGVEQGIDMLRALSTEDAERLDTGRAALDFASGQKLHALPGRGQGEAQGVVQSASCGGQSCACTLFTPPWLLLQTHPTRAPRVVRRLVLPGMTELELRTCWLQTLPDRKPIAGPGAPERGRRGGRERLCARDQGFSPGDRQRRAAARWVPGPALRHGALGSCHSPYDTVANHHLDPLTGARSACTSGSISARTRWSSASRRRPSTPPGCARAWATGAGRCSKAARRASTSPGWPTCSGGRVRLWGAVFHPLKRTLTRTPRSQGWGWTSPARAGAELGH